MCHIPNSPPIYYLFLWQKTSLLFIAFRYKHRVWLKRFFLFTLDPNTKFSEIFTRLKLHNGTFFHWMANEDKRLQSYSVNKNCNQFNHLSTNCLALPKHLWKHEVAAGNKVRVVWAESAHPCTGSFAFWKSIFSRFKSPTNHVPVYCIPIPDSPPFWASLRAGLDSIY